MGNIDYYVLQYNNPDTIANDVTRFITEGCRESYNKVYLEKSGSDPLKDSGTDMYIDPAMVENTFVKDNAVWKYINYGDFLEQAAKESCQWRDYEKKCYCSKVGEKSFVDVNTMGQYLFYDDLRNGKTNILSYQ